MYPDRGQRSIEHMGGRFWGVLIGPSAKQPQLYAEEVQIYQDILTVLAHNQPPPTSSMRAAFSDGRSLPDIVAYR